MSLKSKKSRYIKHCDDETKLLKKQKFKCANFPESNLCNIGKYECKLWKHSNGTFDEAGYQIDHMTDHLQLLCPPCHAVKTFNSRDNNRKISTSPLSDNDSSDDSSNHNPSDDESNHNSSDDSSNHNLSDNYSSDDYSLDEPVSYKQGGSYECETCFKKFDYKDDYSEHVCRKFHCKPGSNSNRVKRYICDKCRRKYSNKDHYNNHICISKLDTTISNKTTNNKTNNRSNFNNDNSINIHVTNNIYANRDNPIAFAKNRIDCLSFAEKNGIPSANDALETIIITINLNPNKINHHNVFYKDIKNGYGIIYDGKCWIKERVSNILETLRQAREKNLLEIFYEAHFYLAAKNRSEIENFLKSLNNILGAHYGNDIAEKKNKQILFSHVKKHMANNSTLTNESTNHTNEGGMCDRPIFDDRPRILQGTNYSIDDIERGVTLNKQLKETSNYLLSVLIKNNFINANRHQSLLPFIKAIHDNSHMNIVIRLLGNAVCFNEDVSIEIVSDEIEKHNIIEKYIRNNFT